MHVGSLVGVDLESTAWADVSAPVSGN